MNDNSDGGIWRSEGRGSQRGRARGRELSHGPHALVPQAAGAATGPRADIGSGSAGDDGRDALDYMVYFRELWRRKWLFAGIVVLGTSVGIAVIARLPQQYVAHALMVIGGSTATGLSGTEPIQAAPPDIGSVQTVVEVLSAPQLAAAVIRRLSLEDNPEFNPVAAEREGAGTFASAARLIREVRQWCCASDATTHAQEGVEFSRTIDGFLSHLRVSVRDNSRMIDVAFESSDPGLAMTVANALVDEYVNKEAEMRAQSAQRRSEWLRDSIGGLQAKVESAERAVEEFRTRNGLFSMPGGSPLVLKQMTDVTADLAEAQTQRAAIEANLRQLRSSLTADARDGRIGAVVDTAVMRALHAEEADAQQKLAELSVEYGEQYPTTVGVKERLRSIHAAMRRENQRVLATLENDLRIARMKEEDLGRRLGGLKADVARMNDADITLRALERKAEADRRLLDDFVGRLNKAASEDVDALPLRTDAQIASYAQLPVYPERPKKKLLIVVAGIASVLAAALIVHLLEKADRSLRTVEEVERHLRLSVLGMLPNSRAAQLSAPEAARYGSAYREALKAAFLGLFGRRDAPQVVVVSSAMPGEGKTTLALSLASMAAQAGQRVMLLDTDFWKKGASMALGFRGGVGLAEVLEGKVPLPDAIVPDVVSGADIVLPGSFSRGSLLSWASDFRELLESMRLRYDVVIIDTPPVLSASEAVLVARQADATVMTVRWGSTSRDAAAVASRRLRDAGASVAGTVITMVHERQHAAYGYVDDAYFSSRFEAYQSSPTLAITGSSTAAEAARGGSGGDLSRPSAGGGHALLVVDMHGGLGASPRSHALSKAVRGRLTEAVNGVSELAARAGMTVVHTHQDFGRLAAGFSQLLARRPAGHRGMLPDPDQRPGSGLNFPKTDADAFSNPRLDRFLRENGIDHLFIVGLEGATSINRTANSALARGYRVTFIQDGIFTSSESRWKHLLKIFESAAAFAITREEFAEFCQRLRLRRGAAA